MIKNVLKITAVVSLIPAALFGQKQTGWNSLPEDTIAAVNVNFSKNITDKIQNNTNLGKKVFNQQKFNQLKTIIQNHASVNPEMAAGLAWLKASGFELDDIFGLFNNNMGFGILPGSAGSQKYFTVLFWADFNDELINKIYKFIDDKAGEQKKRVDIELDGEKVIHLFAGKDTAHVMITRLGHRLIVTISDFDKNSKYGEFSDGDVKALEDAFQKKSSNGELKIKPFQDEFVEGAETQPESSSKVAASNALGELLKGNTARFLMAQKGEGGEFARRLLSKPGVANARPVGDMVIEGYLDIAKAIELSGEGTSEIELLGLNNLEGIALWSAIDGNESNTSIFVSSPAPRKGLLTLLDQPKTDALPPAWVPENVMNYSHLSFDFNILYNVIKKIASSQLGAGAVDAQEQTANNTLKALMETDIKGLVNSFGKKIYQVNFGFEMQSNSNANALGLNALPVNKTAVVIEFTNEKVMRKLIELAGAFLQQPGITKSQEHGFDGFRIENPMFKGSIFYGQQKLVISIGEGTTEMILSAMANPPKGADALINSKKFIDFIKSKKPEKSSVFSYGDASKMAPSIYSALSQLITREQVLADISNEREKAFANDLLDLLPTESDVEGIFGISHSVGMPIESGFIFKSTVELP
ncbi:MAG: hypothetical protein NE328_15730 [Lentisphaeraceae bacterium]|nr:hypothetical protein [Lentisphaeraceae bacterium]